MIGYLIDGTMPIYYENGQKEREVSFKNGMPDGKFTYWYESGQLFAEIYYKEGKLDGKWLGWYENGQLLWERYYKNGNRVGKWLDWYDDGKKRQYIYWYDNNTGDPDNDEYFTKKCWDKNGQLWLHNDISVGDYSKMKFKKKSESGPVD